MTPWTVARQAPLSMEFPRQEYWSGLSFPSLGDLPHPEIQPMSPALEGKVLTTRPPGKSLIKNPLSFHSLSGLLLLLWWLSGKESLCQCRRCGFDHWVGKIPWRRKWQPTPLLLPGKSHGLRRLAGYSPWGHKESDTTERLHFASNYVVPPVAFS